MLLPTELDSLLQAQPLRDMAQYWFEQRSGHFVTRRSAIDISHFRQHLPRIFLYDYDPPSRGIHLRLAGEMIRNYLPNAVPGAPLKDLMPAGFLPAIEARYRRVCEEPAFMHVAGRVFKHLDGSGVGERLIVPLADDHGQVRQLMGMTLYRLGDTMPDGTAVPIGEHVTTMVPVPQIAE